jgi:hypothetical protein
MPPTPGQSRLSPEDIQLLLQLFGGQLGGQDTGPQALPEVPELQQPPEGAPQQTPALPEGAPPLTPEELGAMSAPAGYEDEAAAIGGAEARAAALRGTPMPQGNMVGRTFVADPGGALLAGLRQGLGAYQGKKLEKERRELAKKKADIYRTANYGEF